MPESWRGVTAEREHHMRNCELLPVVRLEDALGRAFGTAVGGAERAHLLAPKAASCTMAASRAT
jgi:hypothetical protein